MKVNSKVLDGTGKSLLVVQHEGMEVKGDKYAAIADTVVTSTLFGASGLYLVEDTANEDAAVVAIINTAGTLSAVKVAGSANITITADNASTVNAYVLADVLAVQNLTGDAIDFTVKPYI